ncbi:acetyltransferase [Salinicoccus carnicancri]|uniref:acetyltransferase n=1 Tax=Salinicoccus carnicancri TaxID=558170 RepID=UPI00036FD82F|nr:acetyltransferase [Salinicoccus carnicancri]
MTEIVLIGNGGHSKVIQAMIERTDEYVLRGILDDSIEKYTETNGVFYDNSNTIEDYKGNYSFVVAIGDNETRKNVIEKSTLTDNDFVSVLDTTSIISPDVQIGVGTVIMPGAVVNPGAKIGKHSIINTRAVVEHDNTIDDFVHISPGATLAGTVTVKEATHVGAGSTVIPNTTIHQNTVIGAGSVVTHDIQHNSVVVGVPAKVIKRRS